MLDRTAPLHGRGASENPPNRFEPIARVRDEEWTDPEDPAPQTRFLKDRSRSALASNDSPDIGFKYSLNPYRGCEHGCIYCYARPTHEYLGFSAGLDFETNIMVKEEAPELLRQKLSSPNWIPQVIAMSGVTDLYQPVERRLKLTRRCLQVLAEFRNPVVIITKNHLVTRDIDVLAELAQHQAVAVSISITTLDADLTRIMEPRTSIPERRLAAIEALVKAGVPTGVLVAPVIPALTDHELPSIIVTAAKVGAGFAGYTLLRLPHSVSVLFERWLEQHFPDRKNKILNRIRAIRDGKLNDPRFFSRMKGQGIFAEQIKAMFELACRKAGLAGRGSQLSTAAFRRPVGAQLSLFE